MKANTMKNAERKLVEMQQLYEQLAADVQTLQTLNQRMPELRAQIQRLRELYQCDWLESVDELKKDSTAWERVYHMPTSGQYSVLGEDTIWDTLDEMNQASKQLLHHLIDVLA